jgi:hypothetical protein
MNRFKLIVLSSALSLITIGVFAGRASFAPQDVYADDGTSSMKKLVSTSTFNDLNTSASGTQAQIKSSTGVNYDLFTFDNSTNTYKPLYTHSI